MMRKNTLMGLPCLLVAGCMAAVLSGCGAQKAGPTPSAKPRIALVMKSLANEFFSTMEEGARLHQAAHQGDYELLAEGIKDETDVNRQIQLVEQMMAQQVDAIVIAPADSKALVTVCKKAMDAGVVVVNIDNKFDDDVLADKNVRIPFVGPDNRAGAQMVAEYLAKVLAPGDPVAIIEGVPSAFNAIERKRGFEDAMQAAGMKVVTSQSADWDTSKANNVVSAMVTDRPDLKAILCSNDNMALGAVSALRGAGKLDQIRVVGFDNISAVQELVKNGDIIATADQHADQLAVFGIQYALDMLGGQGLPEDRQTPVDLITAADL